MSELIHAGQQSEKRYRPIPLGTRIPEYKARVSAVGWVGERYYWLVQDDGGVVMVPADCLEPGRAE